MTLTEKIVIERQARSTTTASMSDRIMPMLLAAGMIFPAYPAAARNELAPNIRRNALAGTIAEVSFGRMAAQPQHHDAVGQRYSINSPAEFAVFTGRYPFLMDVLVEASNVVRQHFPTDTIYRLEVQQDQEDENLEELVCFIGTSLGPSEALDRLDAFDEAWFLDNIGKTHGRLIFTLEFNGV